MNRDQLLSEIIDDVIASGQRLGDYQVNLLRGYHRWSGADLRGRARKWGAKYARSRDRAFDLVQAEARRRGVRVALVDGYSGHPYRLAIV